MLNALIPIDVQNLLNSFIKRRLSDGFNIYSSYKQFSHEEQ